MQNRPVGRDQNTDNFDAEWKKGEKGGETQAGKL